MVKQVMDFRVEELLGELPNAEMGALIINECHKKPRDKITLKNLILNILEEEGNMGWELKKEFEDKTFGYICRNCDSERVKRFVNNYQYLIENNLVYLCSDGTLDFTEDAEKRLKNMDLY